MWQGPFETSSTSRGQRLAAGKSNGPSGKSGMAPKSQSGHANRRRRDVWQTRLVFWS